MTTHFHARAAAFALTLCGVLLLAGCGGRLIDAAAGAMSNADAAIDGAVTSFGAERLAILTPTAAFGQEENRQSLALAFSEQLARLRPDIQAMPLAQTLSAINAAGLAGTYDQMYGAYRGSGVFDRKALGQVGAAVGARYLVQLKLQALDRDNRSRFGIHGINLLNSQSTNARLFVQVWDSRDGRIVWERSGEAVHQIEAMRGRSSTTQRAIEKAVQQLVRQLPRA
jgi:hypothetical protein